MKIPTVLIVGSALMAVAVIGASFTTSTAASPAVAASTAPIVRQSPFLLADNDDFTARKDEFVRKSSDEMAEWRNKIHAAGERAEAKGHEASAETKAQFNRTWAATEDGWQKLKAESAEGWDKTKGAYERSVTDLRTQWHKIHPEDNN